MFKKSLAFVMALMLAARILFSGWNAVSASSIVPQIPDDAVNFNGHYYKLYKRSGTWSDARSFCESLGGHLATITSQAENDFLHGYITGLGEGSAFFGYTDEAQEGTWVWVTGETSGYTNWRPGEPNSENSVEDYAMFYLKFTDGTWNDGRFGQNSSETKPFLCEWDSAPVTKQFPDGYDFMEDSYSFGNTGVFHLSEKYFTTMFEESTGKLLYKKHKHSADRGMCLGMTYTTAAIYQGYPSVDSFVVRHALEEDERFDCIRDLPLNARTTIGSNEISLHDYIKYAQVYQYSTAVSQSSNHTYRDVTGLRNLVKSTLASDQITVTIGFTHLVENSEGKWEYESGHRVLAVGMEGNDILLDDPNNTESPERLTIRDDGTWTFSGAWTSDGVNDYNSLTRYQTDVTAPYLILSTGRKTSGQLESDSVRPQDTLEPEYETYIEDMDRVDSDKMLLAVQGDGYHPENTGLLQVSPEDRALSADIFWVSDTDTVALSGFAGACEVHLASDDLLIGTSFGGGDIQISNTGTHAGILMHTTSADACIVTLETTGTDGQDVVMTVSGTASDGTVSMKQTDAGIDVAGLNDAVITLAKDGEIVDTRQIPGSDDEFHVEYDPTGNDGDLDVSSPSPFTDVPAGSFYEEAVLWALENGITTGTSDTTFSPDDPCLRSQVVTFLWRTAGSPEPKTTVNPFTDVSSSDYFYAPVLWAVENGITFGVSPTRFGSNEACSRSQVVTFLWRAAGSPEPKTTVNPFTDVSSSDYFYAPVLWAVENGITSGTSDTAFSPTNPCNRAQVITFLYRTYN